MKKLLLSSALAALCLSAGAQDFSDLYEVSYNGKAVANGGTINVTTPHEDSDYLINIDVKPLTTPEDDDYSRKLFGAMMVTTQPTVAQLEAEEGWGSPSICYVSDKGGNCLNPSFTNPKIVGEGFPTFEEWLQWQIHVYEYTVTDYSRYLIQMTPFDSDGNELDDVFRCYINIDPTGAGVDDIAAENAEAVYYDLTGRKVANPQKGIFIRIQGNKAVKVVK